MTRSKTSINPIETVTVYQLPDGKRFETYEKARGHLQHELIEEFLIHKLPDRSPSDDDYCVDDYVTVIIEHWNELKEIMEVASSSVEKHHLRFERGIS